MKQFLSRVIVAIAATVLSTAPVVLTSTAASLMLTDSAIAKGNGNGGGNGGGNGNGNGGGNGNGNGGGHGAGGHGGKGNGVGHSGGSRGHSGIVGRDAHANNGNRGRNSRSGPISAHHANVRSTLSTNSHKSRSVKNGKSNHGAIASNMKGLNAAHASLMARANAAPNSRVGRIATYEQATLGVVGLTGQIADLEDMVDDTVPTTEEFVSDNISDEATLSQEDIATAVDSLDPTSLDYQSNVDAIAADLTGLDPEDPDNEEALADMSTSINDTVTAQDEQADIADDIADLEGQLADAQTDQVEALASAYSPHNVADLTDESLSELHGLLGLSEESIPDVTPEEEVAEATTDDSTLDNLAEE